MFSLLREFIQLEISSPNFQDVLDQITKEKEEENNTKDEKEKKNKPSKKDIDILKDMGTLPDYRFYTKNN